MNAYKRQNKRCNSTGCVVIERESVTAVVQTLKSAPIEKKIIRYQHLTTVWSCELLLMTLFHLSLVKTELELRRSDGNFYLRFLSGHIKYDYHNSYCYKII